MLDKLDEWFAEDFGKGDFTSQAVVDNKPCEANVTGGPGVISGLKHAQKVLKDLSDISFTTFSSNQMSCWRIFKTLYSRKFFRKSGRFLQFLNFSKSSFII